jgi:hypothetical protein
MSKKKGKKHKKRKSVNEAQQRVMP